MKVKAVIFGIGKHDTQRSLPGIPGKLSELYVGQPIEDPHGRGRNVIASIDLDREAGMLIVRRTGEHGKPSRRWTTNADPTEGPAQKTRGDFLMIPVGNDANLICDDELPTKVR